MECVFICGHKAAKFQLRELSYSNPVRLYQQLRNNKAKTKMPFSKFTQATKGDLLQVLNLRSTNWTTPFCFLVKCFREHSLSTAPFFCTTAQLSTWDKLFISLQLLDTNTSLNLTNRIDDSEEKNRGKHVVSCLQVRKRLFAKYNTIAKQHTKGIVEAMPSDSSHVNTNTRN